MLGQWVARGAWAFFGLVLVASACAPSVNPGIVSARSAEGRRQSTEPAPSGWHLVSYPRTPERASWAGRKADGSVQLALDGWRIEVRGDSAVLAEQALFEPIARSCPSGGGWLHFTGTKQVYWSPTYLGGLQHVGPIASVDLMQCGPEVVIDGWPLTLWSKAGPLELHHREPIAWASFSSPLEGRALSTPDIALVTHDGGRTFARGGAIDVAAAALAAHASRKQEPISDKDLVVAVRAWLTHAVSSEAGRAVGGTLLTDGTWLRIGGVDELGIIAAQGPDGALRVVNVSDDCDYQPWGKQLIGECKEARGPGGTPSVRVVYPVSSALAEMPKNFTGPVADAQGRYIFGQVRPQDGERFLVRYDGRGWRRFPAVHGTPRVARHDWVLIDEPLRIVSADEPGRVLFTFPTSKELVRRADGEDDAPRERVVAVEPNEVALLAHNVIFVDRSRGYDAALVEVELPSGRELRRERFRFESGSLGFADAEHGVAASPYESAQLLALGKSPSPLPEATLPQGYLRGAVTCSDATCVIDGEQAYTRLPLRAEKNLVATPKPPPASTENDALTEAERQAEDDKESARLAAEAAEAERWPSAFRVKDYVCELTRGPGKTRFDEELRGSTSPTHENPQPLVQVVPTFGGMLESDTKARSLAWRGIDAQGEYRVRTVESEAMAGVAAKLPTVTGESELLPALLTRRFAVLFGSDGTSTHQRVLIAREGGHVDGLSDQIDHFTIVALSDGRALLRADYELHQELILLAADGSVGARRDVYTVGESYLALRGGEPGLVVMGSPSLFFGMGRGGAGTVVQAPELRYAEPCRTKAKADALQMFVEAAPFVEIAGLDPRSRSWTSHQAIDATMGQLGVIEVLPQSMCLRGVLLDAPLSGQLGSDAPWLHGRVLGQSKIYPVVCRSKMPTRH